MDIRGLSPYLNTIDAPDGLRRPLMWCNRTIKRAIEYMRIMHDAVFDYQSIFNLASFPIGLRAFLYAGSGLTLAEFEKIFAGIFIKKDLSETEKQYRMKIVEGLSAYLPPLKQGELPPEADDYPDIAAHEEHDDEKPVDWAAWFVAFRKIGFSLAEIDDMTWPGMIAAYKQASGAKDDDPAAFLFD